ncbi:hypothetical protein ACNPQM_05595 [Streptomyces sp. NPDC056231]|uniref:hypothetical protein n=1 Tax=Streptomyces sp. NPDC056231 TaxID=3345755 RepID=UPI003AACC6A8
MLATKTVSATTGALCTAALLLAGMAAALTTGPATADGFRFAAEQPWSAPGEGGGATVLGEQPWSAPGEGGGATVPAEQPWS